MTPNGIQTLRPIRRKPPRYNGGSVITCKRVATNLYVNQAGLYFLNMSVNGKPVKRSLKTHDLDVAERRLASMKHQFRGFNGEAARAKFQEFAEHWLFVRSPFWKQTSRQRRAVAIRALQRHFDCQLKDMSFQRVEQWAAKRVAEIMPRSYNYERAILRMILDYAVRDHAIAENPVNGVQTARVMKRKLSLPTAENLDSLFQWMRSNGSYGAADLAQFLAGSGCRISEALHLQYKDVDWLHNHVNVKGDEVTGTKTNADRTVPLFKTIIEVLAKRRSEPMTEDDDLVFDFTREQLQKGLNGGCKALKMQRLKPHDFRHYFASESLRRGVNPVAAAGWLGHSVKYLLSIYAHVIPGHEQDDVAKMETP